MATQHPFPLLTTGPQVSGGNLAWMELNPPRLPRAGPGRLKPTGTATCVSKSPGLAWRWAPTQSEPASQKIFSEAFGENKPSFSCGSSGRRDHSFYSGRCEVRMGTLELCNRFLLLRRYQTCLGGHLVERKDKANTEGGGARRREAWPSVASFELLVQNSPQISAPRRYMFSVL